MNYFFLDLAVFIGCLFFVVMAILRSHVTKLVNETEFALVFIATGIVETLGSYVVGIVTNAIYAETIEIYPGIIFFILAGIGLIPMAIIGYDQILRFDVICFDFFLSRYLLVGPLCKRRRRSVVINQVNLRVTTSGDNESKSDSLMMETIF